MEIFGSTFDESVFLKVKERACVGLLTYNAKVCEPEWFCDSAALDTEDPLEKLKVFKFRADLSLRRGNYQKALDAYSSCLEWNGENMTVKRDIVEGMARCWSKLGQHDKALDLANSLSQEASNICHLTGILLLKVSIYQESGCVRSKMSSLQQLCSLLPFNPWHWFNLAQTCLQLLECSSTTGSLGLCSSEGDEPAEEQMNKDGQQKEAAEFNQDKLWLKACCCYIRTRLLLKILLHQQSSFVLKRSKDTRKTTDEALQRLRPKETTLQALTELMSEDLIPEKMREDHKDGESLSSVGVQDFNVRWWDKILESRVLNTDGWSTQ